MKAALRYFISLIFLIIVNSGLSGQDMLWDEQFINLKWEEFVKVAESSYPIRFFYNNDQTNNIQIGEKKSGEFITVLNANLAPYHLIAVADNDLNIFITPRAEFVRIIPPGFLKATSEQAVVNQSNGARPSNGFMQTSRSASEERVQIGRMNGDNKPKAKVSGYIRSAVDNTPLIGVMVRVDGTSNAVLSDVSGFYSLDIEKGDRLLIAGNLETKEKRINLRILSDGRLDILLEERLVTLNAVVISADKEQIVRSTQMGYQRLASKEIKEIPVVLGEQDIIKVSLLLPGIQTVGEGSSGVNVRGSPTDQNLFMINNIPVYNTSHLLGFFSAFNSDAIRDFELYKSNIPVQNGGRLSSIFDIRARQGNQKNFSAQGGVSPVTARLTVEGPLKKDAGSFLVAVRSTYSDWILGKIDDPDINKSSAGFADAIVNLAFEVSSNNRFNFTTYHSTDRVNLIDRNRYKYANNGGSLTWNHLFKEKNNLNLSVIYSQYQFEEKNSEKDFAAYRDEFKLGHTEFKAGYTMRPDDKHTITAGVNSILYLADQGRFEPLNANSMIRPMSLEKEKALESAIYISDEWNVNNKLTLTGALRYNYYRYLGPQSVKVYYPGQSKSVHTIMDTIQYGNNKSIATYQAPDIRLSARYVVTDRMSVKLGYSNMQQYLFMLSNTIAVAPTDKWKLSDYHIKPMSGSQYSFGVYNSFFNGKIDLTTEVYYKQVNNLVEYKNGANLIVNETPEVDIIQGELEAYGIEFMLNKPKGRLNGWLNYTWSRTLVNIKSPFPEEQINKNEVFPSNFDKPHALNLVANYKFSRRFSFSSNVVYSTGRPLTIPVGFYDHEDFRIPMYSGRNEYRVPDYFRVDVSLKLEGNLEMKKLAHGTWILSIYNATSRKNAYSVFYRYEDGTMKGYKLSIFGVPVVSLTYSFKLGNYAN